MEMLKTGGRYGEHNCNLLTLNTLPFPAKTRAKAVEEKKGK